MAKQVTPFNYFESDMSLWEVAHHWNNIDTHNYSSDIPLKVISTLRAMMNAQLEHELLVGERVGNIVVYVRDGSAIEVSFYDPCDDPKWNGTPEHKAFLHHQNKERISAKHDQIISRHLNMISGNEPYDKKYLSDIYVQKDNLAEWTLINNLLFPDFWFSRSEKQETLLEYEQNILFKERIESLERQGVSIDDLFENEEDIDKYIKSVFEDNNEEVKTTKPNNKLSKQQEREQLLKKHYYGEQKLKKVELWMELHSINPKIFPKLKIDAIENFFDNQKIVTFKYGRRSSK